jgi:hypothetical protein
VIPDGPDLSAAEPGRYMRTCFPPKIVDDDGARARAVLLRS